MGKLAEREFILTAAALVLFEFVARRLLREGFKVSTSFREPDGWLVAERGEGYKPVLCAHLDTVFGVEGSMKPERKVVLTKSGHWLGANFLGCGGDDRAGVISLLESLPKLVGPLMIVCTLGEERGCLGAMRVPPILLTNAAYMIQVDRRGTNDAVFYDVATEQFQLNVLRELVPHKFNFEHGSFTDISVLCPAAGVCGVNLSAGYLHEHTPQERLQDNHLTHMASVVPLLVAALGAQRYVLPAVGSGVLPENLVDLTEEAFYRWWNKNGLGRNV